jgi:hypothetical protein
MDHKPGLQIPASCDDSLASGQRAPLRPYFLAFLKDCRSSGTVDGPIHATAAHKAGVGGIDDGIGFLTRDIAPTQREFRLIYHHLHD